MVSPTLQNEKKQKIMRHWKKISENGSIKSSDTNTDVSNQIFTMSDSIENYVRGSKQLRELENYKVFVKSFSGAKVMCMENYVQPTLREIPTHMIHHVEMNDVPTKKTLTKLPRILLI